MTIEPESNTILLMPVSSLFGLKFIIPYYQRGYRWNNQQVSALLNDFFAFSQKHTPPNTEFYCLQPVIVKKRKADPNNEDDDKYEVIDGQQRLTTIRILLSFLSKEFLNDAKLKNKEGKELYSIDYVTRPQLINFLDHIVDSPEKEDNIDHSHIWQAYHSISEWFRKKKEEFSVDDYKKCCASLLNMLVSTDITAGVVQVIWYELKTETAQPIEIFIRINLGKIPLTNAELIKALFLLPRESADDSVRLKQLQLAQEWDWMERQLQEENFWWFLNKEKNSAPSHIELIFDMMAALAPIPKDKIPVKDTYQTFHHFNELFSTKEPINSITSKWKEVKGYFEAFREWYNHPTWYHYIGFLIYTGIPLQDIYTLLAAESIRSKDDITQALINEIKKIFNKVQWEVDGTDYRLQLSYGSKADLLLKFFLLYNLEVVVNKSKNNPLYKFPFKNFKVSGKKDSEIKYDIEHINSSTENPLKKNDQKKEWLENARKDIPDLGEALISRIDNFLHGGGEDFDSLYDEVIKKSGEEEMDEAVKNSLGNLTLLDAGTNRAYGNALFTTKRKFIIKKDEEGTFIPAGTQNVFSKYFSNDLKSTWTADDVQKYGKAMEKVMEIFLTPTPQVSK